MPAEIKVIEGGTLIDGTGGRPLPNAVIVIEGNRIKTVARRGELHYPSSASVVNAQGKFILPGLWDCHVHYRSWLPELFLHYGITSIICLGDPADWILAQRDGIARGKIPGPRIFACGEMLGASPLFANTYCFRVLNSLDEARAEARRVIEKGVDAVKVWAYATVDQIRVIAGEAHKAGLRIIGHLTIPAKDAIEAGVDWLAHGTGIPESTIKDRETVRLILEEQRNIVEKMQGRESFKPGRIGGLNIHIGITPYFARALMEPETFDELIELMVRKDVYIEPNLVGSGRGISRKREQYEQEDYRLLSDPRLRYIPDHFRLKCLGAWRYAASLKDEQIREIEIGSRKLGEFLKRFVAAGGKVLAGSDTAASVMPALSAHRELELLVEFGLSPMEAILSATSCPAEFLGKSAALGTIAPGKLADLVVVNGDPLANIANTRKVELVFKEGKEVDRTFHPDFSNPVPQPYPLFEELRGYPIPRIKMIDPIIATEGDDSAEIRIKGSGFVPASLVSFDGVNIPTYYISPTELVAAVPATLLKRAGTFPVIVSNPLPVLVEDPLHEDERSNVKFFVVKFK